MSKVFDYISINLFKEVGEIKQKTMIISLLLLFVMIVSVSATFAANNDTMAVDNEITEDILTTEIDDSSDELSDGESNVVTKDNFGNYFDEHGTLTSDAEELVFEGDFSELSVSAITIYTDHPVKFTGNDATFKNVQFQIFQGDVSISGFNIITDENNEHTRLIYITGADDILSNIVLSNNKINFIAPENEEGYAIFAGFDGTMGGYPVSNLQIINNDITYIGDTNGTGINNVIHIAGDDKEEFEPASGIIIERNYFDIQMPEVDINWILDPDSYSYIGAHMTEGIVFYYCEDVKFINNKIDFKYTKSTGSAGTIYVVSAYNNMFSGELGSKIEIKGNEITAVGNYSIYAVHVDNVEDFSIENNLLDISADYYYANGVNVEGPSSEGSVANNTIYVSAPTSVYGIYTWQMMGGISDVSYINNTIVADSYLACGMEIGQPDLIVINNEITAKGNYTYGIAASIRPTTDKAIIENNIITCLGNNEGFGSGDPILKTGSAAISTLGNVEIKSNKLNSTCIGIVSVDDGEVILSGNDINVNVVGNPDNYAVKVTEIGKLIMTDNTITFNGKTDGEKTVTNAMYVFDTEGEVSNNTFNIVLPSSEIVFGPEPLYEETILSEGIVFDYVNNLLFKDNKVDLSYGDVIGDYDTLRGIDVSNSANVSIVNNDITAVGNKYMYALKLGGDNFTIANNDIFATSNGYSNGINLEGSSSGKIDNNNISAVSPDSSYPIYVGMVSQNINATIINNDVIGQAYYVVGIEVGGDNTLIENNSIDIKGNHTIGIGAYVNKLTVNNNNITSDASNMGNIHVWDNCGTNTTGIKVLKGNSTITNNDIRTTGDYTIDLVGNNATITDNYLVSKSVGDKSIINATNAVISGSSPKLKSILTAVDLYTVYDAGDIFYVSLVDEDGNPIANATIFLSFGADLLNETTDAKGVAAFLVDEWPVDDYTVDISYKGNATYGPKDIKGFISIDKGVANIVAPKSVNVLLTAVKKGEYYTIKLTNDNGFELAGEKVSITFNGKTQTFTTDALGVVKFKLSATKAGTQNLVVKFDSNDNYVAEPLTAIVKINKEATKLTAKAKKFKAKVKTKKYTVTLKDSKGKAIKKAKVTIKVKGKTFKAKTNAKGKAIFKIKKLNKKGTYKATVKFAGNSLYNAVSKKVKITVKK